MLIRDLPDDKLLEEWWMWDHKIRTADGWGAGLSAAAEFRRDCKREIDRRNAKLALKKG